MLGETATDMTKRGDFLLYSSPTYRYRVPSCFFLFPERVKHNDVEIRDKGFANTLRVLQRDDEDKIITTDISHEAHSFDSLCVFYIIGANVQMTSSPREKPYASL
ncbi:MAG TPA: hypothetical protein VLG72_06350 [Nitrospirota bacterium]|nr:hypothetical protein [Nitrospirota bacterium]